MSSYTIATAIVFWHRYFALKSLKRNDRFIMLLSALFLAGKAEDEPKALNDIIYQCWKIRCGPEA
jgi:cyclin T